MHRSRSLLLVAFLSVVALLPCRLGAAAADLRTPEGAVAAYVEAIARQDFKAVIAASYVERASKGFDLVAQVGRSRRLMPTYPMPPNDPFFAAINEANFAAQIGHRVQLLTYSLLSSADIARGGMMMKPTEVEAFAKSIQAGRLSGLSLVKVGVPNPTVLNSKINQANWDVAAKVVGTDAQTERMALLSFEGATYALALGLLRYGDDWFVGYQGSDIAGDEPYEVATPITPEAFEDLLR